MHKALLPVLLVLTCPAQAEDARDKIKSDLKTTLEALNSAEKDDRELDIKRGAVEEELQGLQKELVALATNIKAHEKQLIELEESHTQLVQQEAGLSEDLESRKKRMDALVMGMVKLSMLPPEAVIAMPGDFDETLRTAKVLGLTSATVREQAEIIKKQLEEIQALRAKIVGQREQIEAEQKELLRNRNTLETKLNARNKIQAKVTRLQSQRKKEIQKLESDSRNLRELLADLEKRHQEALRRAKEAAKKPKVKPSAEQTRTPIFSNVPLPAEGKIVTGYRDKTEEGETNQGITVRTRENAAVTAPADGEIVYTGPFPSYGNLLIIRHKGKYHSLLAGMTTIQSKTGQKVLKGEPIGNMGSGTNGTSLYVEIRKDNRPIDPLSWLGNR